MRVQAGDAFQDFSASKILVSSSVRPSVRPLIQHSPLPRSYPPSRPSLAPRRMSHIKVERGSAAAAVGLAQSSLSVGRATARREREEGERLTTLQQQERTSRRWVGENKDHGEGMTVPLPTLSA